MELRLEACSFPRNPLVAADTGLNIVPGESAGSWAGSVEDVRKKVIRSSQCWRSGFPQFATTPSPPQSTQVQLSSSQQALLDSAQPWNLLFGLPGFCEGALSWNQTSSLAHMPVQTCYRWEKVGRRRVLINEVGFLSRDCCCLSIQAVNRR